jgi:prepilin-type processing-associated H-X9-DG protein
VIFQPWEFIIIIGVALGTFIIANSLATIRDTCVGIIGALQTGFSALNRFFAAVLARSGQARAPTVAPSSGYPVAQSPAYAAGNRGGRPLAQTTSQTIAARQPLQPRKILERGWVKDRAYVLFVDGSVEIETMLGRRMFPSLQEAQEFVA